MSNTFVVIDLADIAAGIGGFVVQGEDVFDLAGRSVASAGDANGDGFDDLIVGASLADAAGNAKPFAGAAYVVFGRADGFATSIDLAAVAQGQGGFVIQGEDAYDAAGLSVAAAGDLNGDGFDDLSVGARLADAAGNAKPNAGAAYVVFGNASFGAAATLAIAAADADRPEGDADTSAFTFTVTRSSVVATAVTVGFSVTGSGIAPADASDFDGGALATGTVEFAAGETTQTITIRVAGDTLAEADEAFTVTLSDPSDGAAITTGSATGTILNDDVAGPRDDLVLGTDADEALRGLGGDDTIDGGGGDDRLVGGRGADQLTGGTGDDTLTGGGGADLFVFGTGGGHDVVRLRRPRHARFPRLRPHRSRRRARCRRGGRRRRALHLRERQCAGARCNAPGIRGAQRAGVTGLGAARRLPRRAAFEDPPPSTAAHSASRKPPTTLRHVQAPTCGKHPQPCSKPPLFQS